MAAYLAFAGRAAGRIVGATALTFALLAALGPGSIRALTGLSAAPASIGALLAHALPVTLAAVLPGFVLGHVLGFTVALAGLRWRGRFDRWLGWKAGVGTSLSFVIVLIAIQALLCSPAGLDLLPARGWDLSSFDAYCRSIAAPTVAMTIVTAAHALRDDRAVLLRHAFPGAAAPIVSRALLGLPALVTTGSLLLETQFGIPGLGQAAIDAISHDDAPVLLALGGLGAAAFSIALAAADALGPRLDPRMDAP